MRVLVIGPSWVGDMVMAQSLFKVLKAQTPEIKIDILAPVWSRPLLARMPEVHEAIIMPLGHNVLGLRVRYALGRTLAARGYDWAIVLPNSFKSALVPLWARIPRRTGYVGEMRFGVLNDLRRLDKARLPMTVQRFVALAYDQEPDASLPLPNPRLQVQQTEMDRKLLRLGLNRPAAKLLVLCPGAEFGPSKRWPVEYYAQVASTLLEDGWTVWVLGSEKDAPLGQEIVTRTGAGCFNLAGKTRLEEAIDLLSLADCVVTNDSGLMHVAAALDRPMIAIYGSTDPGFTPPLSAKAQVLRLGLPCSPCFKHTCPLGHLKCLRDLDPDRVLALIQGQGQTSPLST